MEPAEPARSHGPKTDEKAIRMTAKAAKIEAFDNARFVALTVLFALSTALLSSLVLAGNLLLRFP